MIFKIFWKVLKPLFFVSKAILIVSVLIKFLGWKDPNFISSEMNSIATVLITVFGCIISFIYLVLISEPLDEQPDWSIVFPELREK